MEKWRPVEGFEEYYEISSLGRCRSKERTVVVPANHKRAEHLRTYKSRLLTPKKRSGKYTIYEFNVGGFNTRVSAHILVAQAFLDNPQGATSVGFKDGDRNNYAVDNLFWKFNGRLMTKGFMYTLDKVCYENTILENGGL